MDDMKRAWIQPNPDDLEPGLLAVFRLFTAIHLVMVLFGASVFHVANPDSELLLFTDTNVVWVALLLGYLSWPALQQKLGRAYLPLGLFAAAILPLLQRAVYLHYGASVGLLHSGDDRVIGSAWQLMLALIIPLILIGWQYRYRVALAFVVVTTLVDLAVIGWVWGRQDEHFWSLVSVSMARALIFVVVGYIITRLMGEQRRQRRALAEANVRIVHYASTVEQLTVSRERNRLARELHDTLAHTLSGLTVQLEAVDSAWDCAPDQARGLLVKSLANARSGLTETRRALQALRASPLEDLGLALAVRNLAESVSARGGLELALDVDDALGDLPPDVEQAVYRVAQEALANVLKHASARHVGVTLQQPNGQLLLEVEDDGLGFDPDAVEANGHYGVRGMSERAELIGGQLSVRSAPGQGTRVGFQLNTI